MASGTYISINTANIGSVSSQAAALGSKLEETGSTLKQLQSELAQKQNVLEPYFRMCFEPVIPTWRLKTQQSKMDEIVSLLAQAEQLATDASSRLNTEASALKLAVAAMGGLAAAVYTTAVSVISKALTGETDCGDDWAYVGSWGLSPLEGSPKITSHYGPRNLYGSFHYGIDFGVPKGTQVKAPVSGTVLKAYTQTGGGNCVYLLGDDGYLYEFAHLSEFQCKTGDRIEAGSNIALSGATGQYVTGPHLHFGVYKADQAVKNNKINWKTKTTSSGEKEYYIPGSVDPEKFFKETYGIDL